MQSGTYSEADDDDAQTVLQQLREATDFGITAEATLRELRNAGTLECPLAQQEASVEKRKERSREETRHSAELRYSHIARHARL